jgi:hypothetical protein
MTDFIILLAQRSRMDNLSDAFRNRPNAPDREQILWGLLLLAALVAGIWLLSRLLALRERRRTYSSPLRLFLSLCRAHRLRWSERWLLWQWAKAQRLKDPGRLFLEAERFAEPQLGQTLPSKAARLREIRDRLFAGPPRTKKEAQNTALKRTPKAAAAGTPLAPPLSLPSLDVPPWSATTEAT